ncbi:MAG: hypothetical protein ACRDQA_27580 [Nocardioidaceae bacterium]
MRAVGLDELFDLEALWRAHNATAQDDPSGAERGYSSAATANDTVNAPMLAVNDRLGYTEITRAASMVKTLTPD